MRKLFVIHPILVVFTVAMLSACSLGGYQKIEEKSLPRYQKGTPVMSDMKIMCRAQVIVEPKDEHPSLDFMVVYDDIWDVTVYPTAPKFPRKYNPKWCQNGVSTQVITHTGIGSLYTKLEPEYKYDIRRRYNLDPSKGAVRVWTLPRVEIDGLNYRATMVTFLPMIIKGHMLPTYSWFSDAKFTTNPHTRKEVITLNGRTWQYYKYEFIVGRDIPEHGGYKAGHTSFDELYTTTIGDYMFAMVAGYDDDLATNAPAWLNQRRAFLREWLESFEFVPINHTLHEEQEQ